MTEQNKRDAIHDNIVQGLTVADRAEIRRLKANVVTVFQVADTKPEVAFVVLLNVLGALIGTQLEDDREQYTRRVQTLIPFYVETYRNKEKKIGD